MKFTAIASGASVAIVGDNGRGGEEFAASTWSQLDFINAEQNAKDIAHRYNVHDKLVEALEGLKSALAERSQWTQEDKSAYAAALVVLFEAKKRD